MEKKPQKNPKKYYCEKCDFTSKNKKDFNRHLSTRKHQMDTKNIIVKNVTLLLRTKKILIVIYPLENIKWITRIKNG